MIDEEELIPVYSRILIKILVRDIPGVPEIPELGDDEYFNVLEEIARKNTVFDPITKRFQPIINVKKIKRNYYVYNIKEK